jgi:O-antigen ligase
MGVFSFYSLMALFVLVAIPYGSAEPWWKAVFQCLVFTLAGLVVIQKLLWKNSTASEYGLLLPIIALIAFALLQTVPWSHHSVAGIEDIKQTLSADASQTRLFILQLSALVLAGWLLVVHTTTRTRLRFLTELIIAVGVISAGFGLLRQLSQGSAGFGLPYLRAQYGYAQFINRDHFAFMIEMVLGLTLGIVVCGGVRGVRFAVYLLVAIPMWVALVLSNSRGGILSMLCQVLILAYLAGTRLTNRRLSSKEAPEPPGKLQRGRVRSLALRLVLIIALLASAVVGVFVVGGDPLLRKLDATSAELDPKTAESYTLRLNIWQATWALIKDHPFAGAGFGGYWIAITKYHHATGEITPQQAHSDYLELAASGGVIGIGLGIWFVAAFVRAAGRKLMIADQNNRPATLGALTGIITVAIHSLVDFGLHITINTLLLTTLMAIVLINVKEERIVAS